MNHLVTFSLVFALLSVAATASERPAKPNIVLILTDDLGWQDVKCYDLDEPSPMETPHLDAFAKTGIQFWQAYSPSPTCAPSRCAILSGVHPARAQKTHVVGGAPPKPSSARSTIMDPWYSGRMPEDTLTIAGALSANGYVTGHSGKWHIAIDHHAFPQPKDVGFDYTRSSRGARQSMKNRLAGFATTDTKDPYHLDDEGFPFHQTNEDALDFMRQHKGEPFFLYYATWLVHTPIHTRSEELLKKYAERLGIDPEKTPGKETRGQQNPFYCAMVEELDHYIGTIFSYLDETEDPRWPGHKLSENTYVIFTSDNGGMEGSSERYTDNRPLSRGKISAMEGGTRVPLFIAGPRIPKNVQTDVMVNGLDFYPTILSMTGTSIPSDNHLDGCDIFPLLTGDPADPNLIKNADDTVRASMMWHFPHGGAQESTLRDGEYKLVRNYNHLLDPKTPEIELFQLYDNSGAKPKRVDIEESKNLAKTMPERAKKMNEQLSAELEEMKASFPLFNPDTTANLPNKNKACTVTSLEQNKSDVKISFEEHGAKVTNVHLIYTKNGKDRYEEWFRKDAAIDPENAVASVTLPEGTTHFYLNLIDENHFLRSYPEVSKTEGEKGKGKKSTTYTDKALTVGDSNSNETKSPKPKRIPAKNN